MRHARHLLFLHIVVVIMALGAIAPASARALKVVALGDSLTAGYGLGPGEAFPAMLEKALREKGIEVSIANAGVSGDTAPGGAERLDWSVPDGTDAVLLELGANDALRGLAPAVTRQALETMIQRLQQRGIAVMLLGMKAPPNLGADYVAGFDPIYPELAAKYRVPLYPFFLEGVAADASLNQKDGIHPTLEGVTRIVAAMLPQVEGFLRDVAAKPE